MRTRITKTANGAVPRTREEMEAMVQDTIATQLTIEKRVAERDELIQRTTAVLNNELSGLNMKLARNLEMLEAWSCQHKEEFGGDKSMLVHGHRLGWKLGNWKTELCRKWKWADVLAKLKEMGKRGAEFIRTKEEPNKETMIASREDAELLASFGVRVIQEETFFLAPDREGQAEPLMTT